MDEQEGVTVGSPREAMEETRVAPVPIGDAGQPYSLSPEGDGDLLPLGLCPPVC